MTTNTGKILIVDDDEDVLIALERLLEGEGYRTVTAWSREQALELSTTTRFDLILVDEHLADVDGCALSAELERTQPEASRFLIHTRKESFAKPSSATAGLCKWNHGEIMAKIRRLLPA